MLGFQRSIVLIVVLAAIVLVGFEVRDRVTHVSETDARIAGHLGTSGMSNSFCCFDAFSQRIEQSLYDRQPVTQNSPLSGTSENCL